MLVFEEPPPPVHVKLVANAGAESKQTIASIAVTKNIFFIVLFLSQL
jgi:hypothetical protein